MVRGTIAGFGSAFPPSTTQAELWERFFAGRFASRRGAEQIWANVGVEARGGVVTPIGTDVSSWGTGARMERFMEEAMPLGAEAVRACLKDAGLEPADVDLLTVASCTGYGTPGLDVRLAADLGMGAATQRLHIGHMGCYAAIPGLATVADAATARGRTAVLLCVELCTLHLQPPSDEPDRAEPLDQLVAHALFADAAAAVAVTPGGTGWEVVDVVARTDSARADQMTWDVTDHGFRMGLSPRVPAALAQHVVEVVDDLLSPHGLSTGAVAGWAVHPGGPRIIDIVGDRLGLDPAHLLASRQVLRDHGNCSSPTVLVILQNLVDSRSFDDGDHVVAMAFGPGLTLYAALLRRR